MGTGPSSNCTCLPSFNASRTHCLQREVLDVVEVGRDLCEQGEEAPVVAEVDGHQGQEGRRRQDRRERRERQLAALVA